MSRIINTEAAEHTESFEWAALRAAGRTFARRVPTRMHRLSVVAC